MKKNHARRRIATLAAAALCAPLAQASLPAGIGGAWYNPEQSGHGLSIEILAPDRALLFWYLYDTEGKPFFLYLDGRIEGRRIEATAFAPTGLRFGSFDRSDFDMPEWGSVSIDFDDCNHGLLNWDANSAEFGSGSTELRRLTRSYGSDCTLEFEPVGPQGLVKAEIAIRQGGSDAGWTAQPAIGAIDPNGRLWAIEFGNWPDTAPRPGFVGPTPCVALGAIERETDSLAVASLRELPNTWMASGLGHGCDGGTWQDSVEVSPGAANLRNSSAWQHRLWQFTERSDAQLLAPLAMANLSGSYQVDTRWQFGTISESMQIDSGGRVCLDPASAGNTQEPACTIAGRIWVSDPVAGFFDFELGPSFHEPHAEPYRGRGWIETRSDGDRLVLVGDNGARGMGLVGR